MEKCIIIIIITCYEIVLKQLHAQHWHQTKHLNMNKKYNFGSTKLLHYNYTEEQDWLTRSQF